MWIEEQKKLGAERRVKKICREKWGRGDRKRERERETGSMQYPCNCSLLLK